MNILHQFTNFLPPTQNWAYQLINNEMEAKHFINAKFQSDHPFDTSAFHFLNNPNQKLYQKLYTGDYNRSVEKFSLQIKKVINQFLRQEENVLLRQLENISIDLVHSHFANTAWHFKNIPKRLKVPHVVSFYGYDYEFLPHTHPKWKRRYMQLFKEVDLFLCEGENGGKILEAMGCPRKKIAIQPLGINTIKIPFHVRPKKSGQLKLIQIASYTEKKGQMDTLKAFHTALDSAPQMTLTFVGGEKNKTILSELKKYVQEHQLSNKVQFLNFIAPDELHDFLQAYDVFIHPSKYADNRDCEGGAPIVILDAQATGMPVISTTHCDIPSEVTHKKTGLLTVENSPESVAQLITEFYQMEYKEYSAYAHQAREHVLDKYDVIKNAQLLTLHYKKLIDA